MEENKLDIQGSNGIRGRSWMQFISVAAVVLLLSGLASLVHVRIDLTEDNRHTLSEPTRKILSELKNDLYIQVWLDGDMPVQFKKLRRSVKEMLDEFRIASGRKLDYEFINPSEADDAKERNRQYESLGASGLYPVNVQASDKEGGASQKIIFPGLTVNYNGTAIPVNFLKNNLLQSAEQNLLHSMEGLEYEMIQTISTITSDTVYKVAFIEGHGEINEDGVADITLSLAKFFTIDRGVINGKPGILDYYSAIVIAGPEKEFDERDKLVIDQYIMKGGKVLWLYEEVKADADSLVNGETVALFRPVGIEDQLFVYGARVNPSLVQDLECVIIPMKVVTAGTQQQMVPVPWLYYPLLYPSNSHPVTRNLNRVAGKFVNYIDTVGRNPGIKKTILLSTSEFTKLLNPPVLISLMEAGKNPDSREFTRTFLPAAVLLEGRFQSAFRNRPVASIMGDNSFRIRNESVETKMIVIADGDIIRNEIRRSGSTVTPVPLGLDRYTMQTFGNKDFLINCLNYLVDDNGIMQLRSRELKMRLLNKQLVKNNLFLIRIINVVLPLLLVIVAGLAYSIIRKKMYANNR
jgi:gliding-associated putative ABC transporter substrate-binding component GldG